MERKGEGGQKGRREAGSGQGEGWLTELQGSEDKITSRVFRISFRETDV